MVFYLFFHTGPAFTSVGKAKWKINQQHANFYLKFLRIVHQIAFVLQVRLFHIVRRLSQEYATQDVYLLLKEKFSEFSWPEVFSTEDKYFLPPEELGIRGANHSTTLTDLLFSRKIAIFSTILTFWDFKS